VNQSAGEYVIGMTVGAVTVNGPSRKFPCPGAESIAVSFGVSNGLKISLREGS